jgi:hypothetical protein
MGMCGGGVLRLDQNALCVEEGFFFAAADGAADSITRVSVYRFYLLGWLSGILGLCLY